MLNPDKLCCLLVIVLIALAMPGCQGVFNTKPTVTVAQILGAGGHPPYVADDIVIHDGTVHLSRLRSIEMHEDAQQYHGKILIYPSHTAKLSLDMYYPTYEMGVLNPDIEFLDIFRPHTAPGLRGSIEYVQIDPHGYVIGHTIKEDLQTLHLIK